MKHYLSALFVLALTATTGKLSASESNLQEGFKTPAQKSISINIEQHTKDLKAKRKEEKKKRQNIERNHTDPRGFPARFPQEVM